MRHVLEHNMGWEGVLINALNSFTKRMVLVIFTQWSSDNTKVIASNYLHNVPDISFAKEDITRLISGLNLVFSIETIVLPNSPYGIEHVLYIERAS